ncbi:MAG: hypothetical protein U0414_10715 [Polyangiaceae bacterium]
MQRALLPSTFLVAMAACGPAAPHANLQQAPGSGDAAEASTPGGRGSGPVVDVAVGWGHACALAQDGSVWCWGANRMGEVGDGTHRVRDTARRVKGLTDAVAISASAFATCAVRRIGTVVCWGSLGGKKSAAPEPIEGVAGAVEVSVAASHACARTSDGHVACWGDNRFGQLGDGTFTQRASAADVAGVEGAVGVATGSNGVSCAWNAEGVAKCWGNDGYGVLGRPTSAKCGATPCDPQPGRIEAPDVIDVAADDHSLCAVERSGDVRCWGVTNSCMRGREGMGGDDEPAWRRSSVVPGLKATALRSNLCALDASGKLSCWGRDALARGVPSPQTCGPGPATDVVPPSATKVAIGLFLSCAVSTEGVTCWGEASDGERGNGNRDAAVRAPVVGILEDAPADEPLPVVALAASLSSTASPGFALVWKNAVLHTREHEPVGRLAPYEDDQRGESYDFRTLVRVVDVSGEWATIETTPSDARELQCSGERLERPYRLRASVRMRDLSPVVARDVTATFEDGTEISVGKGTAVEPVKGGFQIEGLRIALPLDPSAFGLSFEKPGLESVPRTDRWLADDARVFLGGLRVATRRTFGLGAIELRGDTQLATIASPCLTMRVRVEGDPVASGGGAGIFDMGGGRSFRIAAGAPAYWSNGTSAGETTSQWSSSSAPETIDGRMCFKLGEVAICHDPNDVTAPSSESAAHER